MRMELPDSIATDSRFTATRRRPRVGASVFRAALATIMTVPVAIGAMGAISCSTVPDWSARESLEQSITVHYAGRTAAIDVPLPSSTADLLILELEIEPATTRQTFSTAGHRLHLPPGDTPVIVRCRYRQFRSRNTAGRPNSWLPPSQLFPGSTTIRRHD